jgi:hypothetical protein
MKFSLALQTIFSLILSCRGPTYNSISIIPGFNLRSPDACFILPKMLHEISGLTSVDSTSFASIQDEDGILFIYDAINNRIKQQFVFSDDGDYEDIARVNNTLYVLRSDGTLFEISDFRSENFKLTIYTIGIPCRDNEGLCYDSEHNRLLISCKGEILRENFRNKVGIYSFDLETKKLSQEPAFIFDLKTIRRFVSDKEFNLTNKNKNKKDKGKKISLKLSAICIHPITGKLFLLSSIDHMLYVADKNGVIEDYESLDSKLFNQPEGLTFFSNGDMLITNEGGNKKPTLLRFNYKNN